MRFDDMIATVLERPSASPDQRAAQWRQLVDLLAQRRDGDTDLATRAFAFLRAHRAEVDAGTRERVAAALTGLPVLPDLLALFADDHPMVAAPLLRGARLPADQWIALLPSLSPTNRAVLRHRRDLPATVQQALTTFGSSDFVLGSDVATVAGENAVPGPIAVANPALAAAGGRSQIRELVERIERFQRSRDTAPSPPAETSQAVDEFRWEAGVDGVILWVEGAPRGPLVGQSIAAIAERGQHGVDGQAAGAFHKRAPFRDARFSVAGDGDASGDWRISGVPFFDAHRGNFLGYRGTARRPRLGEVASVAAVEAGLFGTNLPPDSLRQLVHELRTPLNAIIGFAEMIEGQYMGPAGTRHRGRANEIVDQARRLLGAVDDLDAAARVDDSGAGAGGDRVDLALLLTRLHRAYQREADESRARIAIAIEDDLPLAGLDTGAAERMLSRLVAATTGLAQPDEVIAATLRIGEGHAALRLEIDRPAAIAGLDELSLLHPGYSPDGDWPEAPALGLGFALRLVRKLAEAAGGRLDVDDARFVLHLPVAAAEPACSAETDRNGGESA